MGYDNTHFLARNLNNFIYIYIFFTFDGGKTSMIEMCTTKKFICKKKLFEIYLSEFDLKCFSPMIQNFNITFAMVIYFVIIA